MPEEEQLYENGDLFDNDNGEYYGRLTDGAGTDIKGPPANITMYYNGFWYNYKMDSREAATRSEDPVNLQNHTDMASDTDKIEDL